MRFVLLLNPFSALPAHGQAIFSNSDAELADGWPPYQCRVIS
jgi:hypothetical protein